VFLDGRQLGNYTVSGIVQPSYQVTKYMINSPSTAITEGSYYGATYPYNDDEEIGFGEGSYFQGNLSELRLTQNMNPYNGAGTSVYTGCTDVNGATGNGTNPITQSCIADWVATENNNMAWPDAGASAPSFISGTSTVPSVGQANATYGGALPTKGFYRIGPVIENP
jgi:hypothetical protein